MRTFGLIGYPLEHSFSSQFFSDKFALEGIDDAIYQNYPLDILDDLRTLIESEPNLLGLNVTIPHKTEVIPLLDALDPIAKSIGAVNTIRINREEDDPSEYILTGYNTDIFGFKESLLPLLKDHHQEALILGTGGSSLAVTYVLEELGIRYLKVSREPESELEFPYDLLDEGMVMQSRIIINTTPVGMYPEIDACPKIPYEGITSDHLVYDLIYNPEETLLLKKSKAKGATIKNGLEMLELQAEKSWEIWNLE